MVRKAAIRGVLALVVAALTLAAVAEAKPAKRYFILPGAGERDAKVSVALSGARLTSGYVLNNAGFSCPQFPKSKGFFIDFGGASVRSGEFRDVDRGDGGGPKGAVRNFRDVVTGEIRGDSVVGKFRTSTLFEDSSSPCRTSKRFTLERVDRGKWRRYTELAREIDSEFNTDG